MRQKYRYILCGLVEGTDEINKFRLLSVGIAGQYGSKAIRVNIPDDLLLNKCSCDSYSTTFDNRTLDELGWDVVVWERRKYKWVVHNELKGITPAYMYDHPLYIKINE